MAETLVLTVPEVVPQITTTDYHVILLRLDIEAKQVSVHVRGSNGERKEFRYENQAAVDLITALNKANLTTKSLQRRILEKLAVDGLLVGTVSGTPD